MMGNEKAAEAYFIATTTSGAQEICGTSES
jgi:hypothetical protein